MKKEKSKGLKNVRNRKKILPKKKSSMKSQV